LHKLIETEKETNDAKTRADSELSRENYQFQFLGKETDQGKEYYVFHLQPLRDNKLLFVGKIWVDTDDFAVARIEASPAKNPSVWVAHTEIEHQYARIGNFWLPVKNRSTSKVRFGGKAQLTIDFKDYQLNAGENKR
jgi:outer membrane lipoprotein-sorting protein